MISIIFLLLLGLCILGFLLYRQKRKIHLLTEKIQELKEIHEIKETKAYLEGRDEERVRIAEDWHDGIGNSLSTLRLIADTIQPKNPERHNEALSLLEHTQREFRQIIDNELVNDFSNRASIMPILEKWQQQLRFGNIELFFKVYDLNKYNNCKATFKSHFYRVVQELLTNVIKHAQASQIQLEIQETEEDLSLRIIDNGVGLKAAIEEKKLFRSLHRRLILLDGKMQIETATNKGTEIHLLLPFINY